MYVCNDSPNRASLECFVFRIGPFAKRCKISSIYMYIYRLHILQWCPGHDVTSSNQRYVCRICTEHVCISEYGKWYGVYMTTWLALGSMTYCNLLADVRDAVRWRPQLLYSHIRELPSLMLKVPYTYIYIYIYMYT